MSFDFHQIGSQMCFPRLRIRFSFAMVGIGGPIGVFPVLPSYRRLALCPGPPINGALLTDQFLWRRAALFSGLRTYLLLPPAKKHLLIRYWPQLMAFAGFALFVVTLVSVRRNDRMKGIEWRRVERRPRGNKAPNY
jgi:hypothetical protein